MAVKSREDARENMMHQNFQSFGWPWWISAGEVSRNELEILGDSSSLLAESIAMLGPHHKGRNRGRVRCYLKYH